MFIGGWLLGALLPPSEIVPFCFFAFVGLGHVTDATVIVVLDQTTFARNAQNLVCKREPVWTPFEPRSTQLKSPCGDN